MDTGLDENEAELGVPVLAVPLEVLADGDGLADEAGHGLLAHQGRQKTIERYGLTSKDPQGSQERDL